MFFHRTNDIKVLYISDLLFYAGRQKERKTRNKKSFIKTHAHTHCEYERVTSAFYLFCSE